MVTFPDNTFPFIQDLQHNPLLQSAEAWYITEQGKETRNQLGFSKSQSITSSCLGTVMKIGVVDVSTTTAAVETSSVSINMFPPTANLTKYEVMSRNQKVLSLVGLPNWPHIKDASLTVQMPMSRDEKVKLILNKAAKRWYDVSDPADEHLPAIVHRDQRSLRPIYTTNSFIQQASKGVDDRSRDAMDRRFYIPSGRLIPMHDYSTPPNGDLSGDLTPDDWRAVWETFEPVKDIREKYILKRKFSQIFDGSSPELNGTAEENNYGTSALVRKCPSRERIEPRSNPSQSRNWQRDPVLRIGL